MKWTGQPSNGEANGPRCTDLAVSVAQSHRGPRCYGMSSPLRLGVPGVRERERVREGGSGRLLLLLVVVSSWLSTPTTVSVADQVVGMKMG